MQSAMQCHMDAKWPSHSGWLGPPWRSSNRTGRDLYSCAKRCRATPLCAALLHNKHGQCYLLNHVDEHVEDNSTHHSIACRLEHAIPVWSTVVSFIKQQSRQKAFGKIGREALRAVSGAQSSSRRLPFDVFLLNLEASKDRLQLMRKAFSREAVDNWRRVPAFYGTDLDFRALIGAGMVNSGQAWNNVGCGLSHFVLWAGLARRANGLDEWTHEPPRAALILEDDMLLHPKFVERAKVVLASCEALNYDICSLYWHRHLSSPNCISKAAPVDAQHANVLRRHPMVRLACERGLNPGTGAYFISPSGAERALAATLPMRNNVDLQLGESSRGLRWFALDDPRSVVSHDFSVRSVRVKGFA